MTMAGYPKSICKCILIYKHRDLVCQGIPELFSEGAISGFPRTTIEQDRALPNLSGLASRAWSGFCVIRLIESADGIRFAYCEGNSLVIASVVKCQLASL